MLAKSHITTTLRPRISVILIDEQLIRLDQENVRIQIGCGDLNNERYATADGNKES